MAKQKAERRSLKRHGVKLLALSDGRHVARWLDPFTGRQQQHGLDKLGLSTEEARRSWAASKAKTLAADRAAIASGAAVAVRVTVADAFADWLSKYEHKATRDSLSMLVGRFTSWAGGRGIEAMQELAPPHLAAFADDYARSPAYGPVTGAKRGKKGETVRRRAPSSVALAMRSVRMFLQWGRKRGYTPKLTSDQIREGLGSVKVPKQPIRFLRPAQLQRLLASALRHDQQTGNLPIAPFTLAVLLSGCRFEEVASLPWSEVDLQAGELQLSAGRVKTRTARAVRWDVSPMLGELLKRLRLRAGGAKLVFGMERGRAEDARRRLVKTFGAPSFSWHDLRRSCGTLLANSAGVYGAASVYLAARRLGHSVVLAEKSYLGVLPDLPREARTIEAAANIEAEARAIVDSIGAAETADRATAAG